MSGGGFCTQASDVNPYFCYSIRDQTKHHKWMVVEDADEMGNIIEVNFLLQSGRISQIAVLVMVKYTFPTRETKTLRL